MTRNVALALAVASVLCGVFYHQGRAIDALNAKVEKLQVVPNNPLSERFMPSAIQPSKKSVGVDEVTKALAQVPGIDKVVELDTKKIRAIRDKEGRVMFLIDNGRFAFVGDMVDVWKKKKLTTIEEIDESFNKVDLKSLGFTPDKANTISVGSGAEHVTAFVDPACPWCHKLINEIKDNRELLSKYTFDFVVLSLLSKKSLDAANDLLCSTAPAEAKINALAQGPSATERLVKSDKTCDTKKLGETQAIANLVGVQSVPFVIAPDGRYNKGKPRDLKAWLIGTDVTKKPEMRPVLKEKEPAQINLKPLAQVNMTELNVVTLGTGRKHVKVFVDPQCGWCHKTIEEAKADPELLKEFTFDFIVVSILGPESTRLVKALDCAKDPAKRFAALDSGKKGIETLEQIPNCQALRAQESSNLKKAMNLRAVPFIVSDDGRSVNGKPKSLREFLIPPFKVEKRLAVQK